MTRKAWIAFWLPLAPAFACSCMGPQPMCSTYFKSELLFTGRVITKQEIQDHPQPGVSGPGRFDVLFQVTESLKGDAGKAIVIHTHNQGSACGFNFEVGKDYFVDGYQDKGEWWTASCSHTHPLAENDADVKWIHGLPTAAPGSYVFGSVHFMADDRDGGSHSSALANVKIMAAGSQGISRVATTSAAGDFRMDALPPGQYKITATAPEGDAPFEPWTVTLVNHGCAEADFHTRVNGRIRGRVLFASGAPADEIYLTLESADADPKKPWERNEHNVTANADGSFDFGPLDPGVYMFGVNVDFPGQQYYRKVYFPSGSARDQAKRFDLRPTQAIGDIEFNLPEDIAAPAIPIRVTFLNKDRSPIANGEILGDDDMWNVPVTPVTQNTDSAGVATILLRRGEYYNVSAFANIADGRQICAEPVGLWAEEGTKPITLIVSHPFGNCRQFAKPRMPKPDTTAKP